MTDRELDHILAETPEIQPSAKFTAAVMQAVRAEARTPPRLRFPWLAAVPMAFAWLLTIAAVVWAPFSGSAWGSAEPGASSGGWGWGLSGLRDTVSLLMSWLERTEILWLVVALLLTAACVEVPLRVLRRRQ